MSSVISEAGVMGYPAKKRHPAAMAPWTQASFPCMTMVFPEPFSVPSLLSFMEFSRPLQFFPLHNKEDHVRQSMGTGEEFVVLPDLGKNGKTFNCMNRRRPGQLLIDSAVSSSFPASTIRFAPMNRK
jgi:hypothetical protein